MLHTYLDVFFPLLTELLDENLVFTGACAVKAHGIKMTRYPNDLDVVIYNPTQKQKDVLRHLKPLAINLTREQEQPEYPDRHINVYKFKKGEYSIDIIICHGHDSDLYQMESDLLYFNHRGKFLKVQSINKIVEAKVSYIYELNEGNGLRNKFARQKDAQDLQDWKNSNFNL